MRQTTINAIYCDDVRQEIGGKISLMGIYGTDMVFPSFPAALHKIHAHVTLKFPYGKQPKHSLIVRLLMDDTSLSELAVDEHTLQNAPVPPPDPDIPDDDRFLLMTIVLIVAPFEVAAPGRLKLRALVDGDEFKGNSLRIRLATPEERQMSGFPPEQPPVPSA